jgi:hypothetical protein
MIDNDAVLEELAGTVLATLANSDPEVLRAFSSGLRMAAIPASLFGLPVYYTACDLEEGRVDGFLANDTMVIALMQAARDEEFVERVTGAQGRSGRRCPTRSCAARRGRPALDRRALGAARHGVP